MLINAAWQRPKSEGVANSACKLFCVHRINQRSLTTLQICCSAFLNGDSLFDQTSFLNCWIRTTDRKALLHHLLVMRRPVLFTQPDPS